jgi:anthranilate phosphoribosyltransferase
MQIGEAIAKIIGGNHLSQEEVAEVFGHIMEGGATPAQIGGLLIALRMKGETADEIAGAARAMRERALPIRCPDREDAVDTCGTGGDGSGTLNISTMAAVVVAAAGGRVAKHGNRAISSRAGSADVLEALGVVIDAPVDVVERCLEAGRIGFLFAPGFHAATRHAAGPRRELGTRTIFNLLGPLTNPARVGCQIVGVFDAAWCEPVARALGALGSRRALVVHGAGGLDEIAVRGPTRVAEWDARRGDVQVGELTPSDFGLTERDPAGLRGGDAADNAAAVRRVLDGELGAVRTATVMAAGAALVASGRANGYKVGAEMAAAAIDSGAASRTLERWIKLSRGADPAEVLAAGDDKPRKKKAPSMLGDIVRYKLAELAAAKASRPLADVEARARVAGPTRGLRAALYRPPGAPVRAIAEVKRASPSVGPIRPGADPAEVAREYAAAGAAAISVLTDEKFFDGHLDFLGRVRGGVGLPILRKDFLIDPYQLVEARAAGADGVLLIAAAVSPDQLRDLLVEAGRLDMDALVEVISEAEADVALAAGARLIGVNHRDLRTFEVDMGLTARLAPRLPKDVVLVAESGIRTADDVRRLGDAGAHAVLVGEALMRAPSPGKALTELMAPA